MGRIFARGRRGALAGIAVSGLLAACSLWPAQPESDLVRVVASSDYCASDTADAKLRYFATQEDFNAWTDARDIKSLDAQVGPAGVLLLEAGRRFTAGYALELKSAEVSAEGVLRLVVEWIVPSYDALVAQTLTSPCIVLQPQPGDYNRAVVVDTSGEPRVAVALPD